MSDKQPSAIRLADWLESDNMPTEEASCTEAAAELRRLHALCDEMGEALEESCGVLDAFQFQSLTAKQQLQINDSALAKWKESK